MLTSIFHTVALAAALASVDALPQQTVSTSSTTTTQNPTILTGDKMGAATLLDGSRSTFIVYQKNDTSIASLSGAGPPVTGSTYQSQAILAAGLARNDTPLALATDYTPLYNILHMFYLSDTKCDGGNYLYQLFKPPFSTWVDGNMNTLKLCSSNQSNFLYALGPWSGTSAGSAEPIRVGFMRASDNTLVEAYQSGNSWVVAEY